MTACWTAAERAAGALCLHESSLRRRRLSIRSTIEQAGAVGPRPAGWLAQRGHVGRPSSGDSSRRALRLRSDHMGNWRDVPTMPTAVLEELERDAPRVRFSHPARSESCAGNAPAP